LNLRKFRFSEEISQVIDNCKSVTIPRSREEIIAMTLYPPGANTIDVHIEVEGKLIDEISIVRCKNGVAINYAEDYMRRRDPDCLIIADELPTDKPRFTEEYGEDFSALREKTFSWLSEQDLIIVPFLSGGTVGG